MNAGYMSLWIMLTALILMATGWRRQLTGNIPLPVVNLAALGLLVLMPFIITFRLHLPFQIQLSVIWLTCWSVISMILSSNRLTVLYCLFGTVMIGSLWFWLRRLYSIDPVFIIIHPTWDGPVVAGLFAGLIAPRFREQFSLLTLSALAGDLLMKLTLHPPAAAVKIGGPVWWDGFLVALCTARFTGGCLLWFAVRKVRFRIGGYRDRGGQSS